MSVNQLIAAGIQQPRFESPLNMMAQLSQIQAAREANELRRMQMAQIQQKAQQENALAQLATRGQPLTRADVAPFGAKGLEFLKTQGELQAEEQKQKLGRQQTLAKVLYNIKNDPSTDSLARGWQTLKESGLGEGMEGTVAEMLLMTPEQRQKAIQTYVQSTPGMAEYMEAQVKRQTDLAKTAAETAEIQARTQQIGQPKEPTPTELARLLQEQKQFAPESPQFKAYQARIEAIGKPAGTTVNVGASETAEKTALGKQLADESKEVQTAAQAARKAMASVESAQRVLNRGFVTGFGTEAKAAAANVLASLGVKEAKKFATDAQTFQKAAMENVLARQLEQKGIQTNQDASRIEQTFTQLGNTPEANQFILDVSRAQAQRAIEQDQFYRKWFSENNTFRGARDAWFKTEGDKSIFDRPELQKYVQPAEPRGVGRSGVINWSELERR